MTANHGTAPRLWEILATLRSRFTFRFSATGRSAAALVTDGRGEMFCEFWRLDSQAPACHVHSGYRARASNTDRSEAPFDAVGFDDGAVLLLGRDELLLVEADGRRRVAGRLPFRPEVVAPAPDGSARVLFVGREGTGVEGECSVWLLPGREEPARRLATLPPMLLRGGGWLDPAGTRYLLNQRLADRHVPVALDLADGECEAVDLDRSDDDRAWLTGPATGAFLLASQQRDSRQLRIALPGRPVRPLTVAGTLTGSVTALAMHPAGGLVALNVRDGLRDQLAVLDTRADMVRKVAGPADRAVATAAWMDNGDAHAPLLWRLTVGSGFPASVAGNRNDRWFEVRDGTPAGEYEGWAPSHLENLPGADSEIEAVVCGHEDWHCARSVVLALHGGPASRWSLKFNQIFQVLAAEGITVIAPNPRGSTGYGDTFHRMIVGRWAGPDLADILALARYVHHHRSGQPVALYGPSYGAFLALIAACMQPELWSRVAAIAPMLSGDRLYAEATAPVQSMIDNLGGRTRLDDELGPRDVIAQLPNLVTPLLVVHGERDEIVPVGQSRKLVEHLVALGAEPDADFQYWEVPGAGHTPLDGSELLHHATARFLAHGTWSSHPPHHGPAVRPPEAVSTGKSD